jgi:hypothetical protein
MARLLNERPTGGFCGLGGGYGGVARMRESKLDSSISERWMTVSPLRKTEISPNKMVDGSIGFPRKKLSPDDYASNISR